MYNSDPPTRAELPTSKQLLRSTVIAVVVAAALLVFVVLPAEYGVDPTGVGRLLNLTEMGEIKQQLAEEAEADAAAEATAPTVAVEPTATSEVTEAPAEEEPESPTGWRDELTMTFAPAAGDDIKLVMSSGDTVVYEWTVDQGHLNSDLHTDTGPSGGSHSYRRGRAETTVAAEFTAVSEGTHGWFWRNRSDVDVTVTLRIRGEYGEIRR